MARLIRLVGVLVAVGWLAAGSAYAQVNTGSVTGTVTDNTGAVLPGVTAVLTGERLIEGTVSQVSDTAGVYRFDRLPPGLYHVKLELQGFRSVERRDIRVNAAFNATVNVQLEIGQLQETITVSGESPTVDTKSNVQQTVMSQEILEGVPTGRDPWAVAKIIPGLQVGVYDVGGTQGMQQTSITSHGSSDSDKIFAIDGLNINWPGGGGGSTMVYYDQGMFEEVNYQTSALPAEVAIGGVFMNMVTKEGSNRWRGEARYYLSDKDWQSENHETSELQRFSFLGGNPVTKQYDFNVAGGGALRPNRLWIFMSHRDWRVDKLQLGARNPDGSFAIDDNRIRNYSGKLTWQAARSHKFTYSLNYNNKQRFHRRSFPIEEDRATYIQDQFGYSTQGKYTTVLGSRAVFESGLGYMHGTFPLSYQKDVKPTDIRIEDAVRNTASVAAPRNYANPNSRIQFDNTFSYATPGIGGSHALKFGVQWARQYFQERNEINGDLILLFNDGRPNAVRIFNTPTSATSYVRQLGFFAQDSWSIGTKLTLNLGARFDLADGWIPEESVPAGRFIGARRIERRDVVSQKIGVWRTGLVYDLFGDGRTAIKANYSRYASNVGIGRITTVHPFTLASGTRAWTDLNLDRVPQDNELGAFAGFAGVANRYADANGPDWPYSDEITAGIERQVMRDLRLGVTYYRRANRKQIGFRNMAVPSTAYTAQTVAVPVPTTGTPPAASVTFYNLDRAFFGPAFNDLAYDNQDLLDTDYNGVEFTAVKRWSSRWQLLAGLTLGKNEGGVLGGDLNDPNNHLNFPEGIDGNDSKYSFKIAGSVMLWGDITVSGSLLRNQGYPYQSTYAVTRTVFPALTRASQTVRLSQRGDERFPDVTLIDLRISRPIRFGNGRQFSPQLDIYNLANASTIVARTSAIGTRYLFPTEILAPRIVRIGFSLDF